MNANGGIAMNQLLILANLTRMDSFVRPEKPANAAEAEPHLRNHSITFLVKHSAFDLFQTFMKTECLGDQK